MCKTPPHKVPRSAPSTAAALNPNEETMSDKPFDRLGHRRMPVDFFSEVNHNHPVAHRVRASNPVDEQPLHALGRTMILKDLREPLLAAPPSVSYTLNGVVTGFGVGNGPFTLSHCFPSRRKSRMIELSSAFNESSLSAAILRSRSCLPSGSRRVNLRSPARTVFRRTPRHFCAIWTSTLAKNNRQRRAPARLPHGTKNTRKRPCEEQKLSCPL